MCATGAVAAGTTGPAKPSHVVGDGMITGKLTNGSQVINGTTFPLIVNSTSGYRQHQISTSRQSDADKTASSQGSDKTADGTQDYDKNADVPEEPDEVAANSQYFQLLQMTNLGICDTYLMLMHAGPGWADAVQLFVVSLQLWLDEVHTHTEHLLHSVQVGCNL